MSTEARARLSIPAERAGRLGTERRKCLIDARSLPRHPHRNRWRQCRPQQIAENSSS